MGGNKKQSDPKVKVISLKQFFETYDYFRNNLFVYSFNNEHREYKWWSSTSKPLPRTTYFNFSGDKFVAVIYGTTILKHPFVVKERLDCILIAYRDGKEEYRIYEEEIERLKRERSCAKRYKRLDALIQQTRKAKRRLPKYLIPQTEAYKKSFKDFLIDTGCKFDITKHDKKYVVFDVETNGFRKKNDDLLSLTIFDPSTGFCYNRFFPLDLQPLVLTSFINGITEETLLGCSHITQEEMNWLIDYFDLKHSILLSYSGGEGMFDYDFVTNYCSRHGVQGFESLEFKNIKNLLPHAPFGSEGQLTKDNLCKILGIDGVEKIHTGINDCILEWKLFDKLVEQPIFFIGNNIFKYNKDYLMPITYACQHPEFFQFAGIKEPSVLGYPETVFEYCFSESTVNRIKKFPTNITGITIEHAINTMLEAEKQDNSDFLINNRKKLEYVATLNKNLLEIPIITVDDGTIRTSNPEYKEYIDEVNCVTNTIKGELSSTIDFIKNHIFANEKIMSQEMIISDDQKVLSLCDLSSRSSVLEVKTMNVVRRDEYGFHINKTISNQIYYQRANRDTYLLSLVFDFLKGTNNTSFSVSGLKVIIYKVILKEVKLLPPVYKPMHFAKAILKELIKDGSQTYSQLSKAIGLNESSVQNYVHELRDRGFIAREGKSNKTGAWKVLKNEEGLPFQN